MKKRIALIAVVLFTVGLFSSFAEAKGCGGKGNGTCQRKQEQKQECKKAGSCEKSGSCEKDGSCKKEGSCDGTQKGQGKGQAQAKGNGQG